jgi:hypothetical protein
MGTEKEHDEANVGTSEPFSPYAKLIRQRIAGLGNLTIRWLEGFLPV